MKNEWDVDAAIATYNVDGWGGGYFTVNPTGNVVARPLQENGGTIDILEVVNERAIAAWVPAGHPISGFASTPCRIGEPRISRGDNRVRLQE